VGAGCEGGRAAVDRQREGTAGRARGRAPRGHEDERDPRARTLGLRGARDQALEHGRAGHDPAHRGEWIRQRHARPAREYQQQHHPRPRGGERAPRSGRIKKIRLIAGGPGSFKLQVAKVKRSTLSSTREAKVVYNGPRISYQGQTEANYEDDSYRVETFKVNVPVKKGQQLALRGNVTSMVRCSSGGDNTLIYTPPLFPGHSFASASDYDGCWLLMEAVIR